MSNNRNALVTGSSRGIGRQTALELAKQGYNIVINYLSDEQAAKSIAQEIGRYTRCITVQADIGSLSDVNRLYEQCKQAFGFIDTLVNNAGISRTSLLIDETESDISRVLSTNLVGAMYTSKVFLPDMISNRFGRIINISSIWGQSGASMESVYSASKAGLIGLTRALSKEVAGMGVTVNAIAPGLILTDMTRPLGEKVIDSLVDSISVGRVGKVEDIANAVKFLADKGSEYISGEVITVSGDLLTSALF